jgi:hypothetical protein
MKLPTWAAAIDEELSKFEVSNCLHAVPDTGQHKVPMMWLFNTHKVRLVIRGDQIIPFVDFYPNAVYCGNVSACSTKICAKLAATYQLEKRDGDIVGAYLVTKSNLDFRWYIQTPQRYKVPEGQVIEAVGNIYGAGQNFSMEFDHCVTECGYKNTCGIALPYRRTHACAHLTCTKVQRRGIFLYRSSEHRHGCVCKAGQCHTLHGISNSSTGDGWSTIITTHCT